jgi:hypothetical protein
MNTTSSSDHHKKLSPMQAIKLKCIDCCYDPQDVGNWSMQVESCTSVDCSLWQHRPMTGKTKRLQRETKLALLTPSERELFELRSQNARRNMLNLRASTTSTAVENVTLN